MLASTLALLCRQGRCWWGRCPQRPNIQCKSFPDDEDIVPTGPRETAKHFNPIPRSGILL